MTTIEAKDAQPGVIYKNARGMKATLVAGLRFRAPSGAEFELEPDTELTVDEEVGPQGPAPAEASSAATVPDTTVPPAWTPKIGDWVILNGHPESPTCVIRPPPGHLPVAVRSPDGTIESGFPFSEFRPAPLRSAAPAEAPAAPGPQAATDAPAESKAARPRCLCSECGEEVSLVKGEVARKHWVGARTEENVCPGSGKPPKGAVAEAPVVARAAPWRPQVGDRVMTTETGDDIAVIRAIDADPENLEPYSLDWGEDDVTDGWKLAELRPVAAPSPGDTFQVQEGADSPTLEAVCAVMSGLEDEQEEPGEGVRRIFSDDLDPAEGEPLAFSVPPGREETLAGFIEGIPRLGDDSDPSIYVGFSDTDVKFAAVPEDEEGWRDCATDPPEEGSEVWTEDVCGGRRLARGYNYDSANGAHICTIIDDGCDAAGLHVCRWKPWKKTQPDQAAEIARLTAEVATAKADAAADARECAEAKEMLRSVMWTLTEIGLAVGEALVTTASTQERVAAPATQAQIVAQVKRLVAENASLRAAVRERGNDRSEMARGLEDEAHEMALQGDRIRHLQAQLAAAEEKVARYHKAARRSARATLAALGDEP